MVEGTPFRSSARDLRLLRRNVAMIFQQHNLVKRLSVLKNVLVGRMADLSPILLSSLQLFPEADVKIARHCLEQVGHDAQGRQPRRRAVGRRAAARRHRPRAGAAAQVHAGRRAGGEPRSQDLAHRAHLPKKSCKESNIAVLCNLHQIDYALEFGERIVGLSAGEVVYDGPPAGVSGDVIRRIYPGLDDPNVLDAAQRLTERRRAAAEAVIAAAALEERA